MTNSSSIDSISPETMSPLAFWIAECTLILYLYIAWRCNAPSVTVPAKTMTIIRDEEKNGVKRGIPIDFDCGNKKPGIVADGSAIPDNTDYITIGVVCVYEGIEAT